MDPTLEYYKSIMHLKPSERRELMKQYPEAERRRVMHHDRREKQRQMLEEHIADRDLVELTLTNPTEVLKSSALRRVVLGQTFYLMDDRALAERITHRKHTNSLWLIGDAAYPDHDNMPAQSDAWKLVYCDVCYFEGGSEILQGIYEARLCEEELQTPAERARETVRWLEGKMARRNAKWVIPVLECLSVEEIAEMNGRYDEAMLKIWKQVSPAPPTWIQRIVDAQQPYGFVYYKSKEVEQRFGRKWEYVWERIGEAELYSYPEDGRGLVYACSQSIHSQGNSSTLRELWTEEWPALTISQDVNEDKALRQHFQSYRESLASPGILRNTFIVIPVELIRRDLLNRVVETLNPYWVWAYDADWDPSSSKEEATSDGERYQGRLKVAIYSLQGWFYAARSEGVSLRNMWLKAQKHPEKLWICYPKEMEEWDHEPYI